MVKRLCRGGAGAGGAEVQRCRGAEVQNCRHADFCRGPGVLVEDMLDHPGVWAAAEEF